MAIVNFTDNLKRHLKCEPQNVSGDNLAEVIKQICSNNPSLKSYLLDDQGRIRQHVLISIDDQLVIDRLHLTDPVKEDSKIYILQALSGG